MRSKSILWMYGTNIYISEYEHIWKTFSRLVLCISLYCIKADGAFYVCNQRSWINMFEIYMTFLVHYFFSLTLCLWTKWMPMPIFRMILYCNIWCVHIEGYTLIPRCINKCIINCSWKTNYQSSWFTYNILPFIYT